MGFISLLELEPTTISRDLKGKFLLLYGMPKVGKTSLSSKFPKNLLLATEVGYNALSSVYKVNIDTWSTFLRYLKELEKDAVKEKYETVTIDTITILWDLCEKFICSQNGVDTLSEIPWGRGFDLCEKQFGEALRRITLIGYGLILTAHSETKSKKVIGEDGKEYSEDYTQPALNKRAMKIVNPIVDVIGYIRVEFDKDGNSIRNVYTRSTSEVMAGSRFPYLDPVIPFGYSHLVNSMTDAIIKQQDDDGAILSDDTRWDNETKSKSRPFEEAMEEARILFMKFVDANNEVALDQVAKSIEQWFGNETVRLRDTTPAQQDLLENVILDMQEIAKA